MTMLIVATEIKEQVFPDIRGIQREVFRVNPPSVDLDVDHILSKNEIWQCEDEDLYLMIETISKYTVNREIKVYKLQQVFTRLPGELKSLTISPAGKLPF